MHQPVEFQPSTVNVDGMKSSDGAFEYMGIATLQPNGKYQCLALSHSGHFVAVVEVTITQVPS